MKKIVIMMLVAAFAGVAMADIAVDFKTQAPISESLLSGPRPKSFHHNRRCGLH